MSDLVKRLRGFGDNPKERFISPNECFAMAEAADRIEQQAGRIVGLEEALRAVVRVDDWRKANLDSPKSAMNHYADAAVLARAALQDDKQEKPAPNPPPRSSNGLEPQF
jgi:hypothetical protein